MATTTTLWSLSPAPLPQPQLSVVDGTFMTIWLIVTLVLAGILHRLLKRPKPTWSDFRNICIAAYILTM